MLRRLIARWEDRAAVRAEMELEPTLRRRFDRLPRTVASRRALQRERRARGGRTQRIEDSVSRSWSGFRDPWL